jgi:hypothetical protein
MDCLFAKLMSKSVMTNTFTSRPRGIFSIYQFILSHSACGGRTDCKQVNAGDSDFSQVQQG